MTRLTPLVHHDQVINVRTGELLDLHAADSVDLAQAREGLTQLRREIDDAAARLDAEIVTRIDQAVRAGEIQQYTVRLDGYEIKVPSPDAGGKVNAAALRTNMFDRAHDLNLSDDAIDGAFKATTVYKLDRRIYSTLAKQAPELNELLRAHTGPPERRRATVTALPGREPVTAAAGDNVIEGQEAFPW